MKQFLRKQGSEPKWLKLLNEVPLELLNGGLKLLEDFIKQLIRNPGPQLKDFMKLDRSARTSL